MSDHDPTDLVGQERAKAEKLKRAQADRETEEADLRWLMGSKRGRRIVWRLLERSGVFRLSFDLNAAKTAFNEGNRNFGQHTLALIHKHCPELYPAMVKEHRNDGRADDGRNEGR